MQRAVGGLGGHRAGYYGAGAVAAAGRQRIRRLTGIAANGVGVAAAVQQEVLILQVDEALRVESHADEVEVRIETVHLQRIFDVIAGRAVAVVVGVLGGAIVGGGVERRNRG